MPTVAVLNMQGKEVGKQELSDAVFGIKPNVSVMNDLVKNYLANQRQGTQSALTRAEVSGGGKKPWRQKGTGRARADRPESRPDVAQAGDRGGKPGQQVDVHRRQQQGSDQRAQQVDHHQQDRRIDCAVVLRNAVLFDPNHRIRMLQLQDARPDRLEQQQNPVGFQPSGRRTGHGALHRAVHHHEHRQRRPKGVIDRGETGGRGVGDHLERSVAQRFAEARTVVVQQQPPRNEHRTEGHRLRNLQVR